jgi:hypothetical protein
MMAQAKLLAEQLLAAVRELIVEVRELRSELRNHKTTAGGNDDGW